MTDYISRSDAIDACCRGWNNTAEDCIRNIKALPSADAVDCTDFIEWLVDRVLDETIWEYNSVAYGEIICRKLEKLGVLEVTEEPSYYIRPSADAEESYLNAFYDGFNTATEALSAEYEDYEHATLVDIKEPLKVSVVRCKDCRWFKQDSSPVGYGYCDGRMVGREVDYNDYCSFGELAEQTERREP